MPDTYDLVIRGGEIVNADDRFMADLAVRDGRIVALGERLAEGGEEVNARGKLVLPGGIDPHAHVEQLSGMGLMNADTFETAHRSAAMGGTTTVISFAAQAKGQRLRETVEDYAARARRGAAVDHAFHLTVTDPEASGFEDDLAALIAEGHRSIKVFTTYGIRLDDAAILRVMALARRHGALVCVHAENDAMIGAVKAALLASGRTRPEHHAVSHPRLAEVEAVERMCRFAEFLGQPVMLFHISTREAATAVRAARARGTPVVAETCPHYLLTTAAVLERDGIEGAKWMCSPPQRTEDDQAALWGALAAGDLALVSSDHAPYRFDQSGKLSAGPAPSFDRIANGLPGLETRLPLLFDALVSRGRGTVEDFVEMTAAAPARIYGLEAKGRLAQGMEADITIWDPQARVTYGEDDLHDNVGYNPWAGWTVTGLPRQVFLRGQCIVDDGGYCGQPGAGLWLRRERIGVATAPPTSEAAVLLEDA